MPPPVVGLTGGIASGKSTVARMFEEHGIPVVDADALAREVVEPGQPALDEIVRHFGGDVLTAQGTLDRKALGQRVFGDESARQRLNAITHPRIARAASDRLTSLADSGAPYVLYEAALLVESGAYRTTRAVVVVSVPASVQLERLRTRDGMADPEAAARVSSQAPLADKLAVADHVIENDGSLQRLEGRVAEVHAALVAQLRGENP